MLRLQIAGQELFDEATSLFTVIEAGHILMEHSLVSLSLWEAKHEVAFLGKVEKTEEQILDYFRCMILETDVEDPISKLSSENLATIQEYMNAPNTATSFFDLDKPGRPNSSTITTELIYYWMVAFNIPFECQTWHLNRLLTLIRICGMKQNGGKKMSKQEMMRHNHDLNAQRRAQMGSSG
ncbi:MAG: hypothetical protein E6R03_05900 [Hyphomicrobiaceae bacterium]|nr:MAG: hypothetical protein E6R03_05900 [Hyphomicrobiaceae bacterium]